MNERDRILVPYTRRQDDLAHRAWKVVAVAMLLLTAIFMGLALAVLPMTYIMVPLVPVILLAAIALWMMPSYDLQYDRAIILTFLAYTAITLVWPEYVAFVIPGIGWAPFDRITMFVLVAISLYALTSSQRLRHEFREVLASPPGKPMLLLIGGLLLLQAIIGFVTLTMSSRWFYAIIFWYYAFIVACWIFAHRGVPRIFYKIFMIGMGIQTIYSVAEYHNKRQIWIDHIPPFMQIDPLLMNKIMSLNWATSIRGYRVHSIYMTALTYAETMAIALPFVVHGVYFARNWKERFLALALLAGILVTIFSLTDTRSSVVGTFVALLGYPGVWALRRMRQAARKRDLLGSATFWAYPFFAAAFTGLVFVSGRLNSMVFGDGSQQSSSDARNTQWTIAIQRFKENPFGYGINKAGGVINFRNPGSTGVTIDSYPINLLINYGPLAWLLFFGFFIFAFYLALRTFFYAETDDEELAGPLALSLTSFFIIRFVLSQEENFPIVYLLAALAPALAWQQRERLAGRPGLGRIPKAIRRRGRAFGGSAEPAS